MASPETHGVICYLPKGKGFEAALDAESSNLPQGIVQKWKALIQIALQLDEKKQNTRDVDVQCLSLPQAQLEQGVQGLSNRGYQVMETIDGLTAEEAELFEGLLAGLYSEVQSQKHVASQIQRQVLIYRGEWRHHLTNNEPEYGLMVSLEQMKNPTRYRVTTSSFEHHLPTIRAARDIQHRKGRTPVFTSQPLPYDCVFEVIDELPGEIEAASHADAAQELRRMTSYLAKQEAINWTVAQSAAMSVEG